MDFPASVLNVIAIAMKHETNYFDDLYLGLMVIFFKDTCIFH